MASDLFVKLNRYTRRNSHKWTSVAECAIARDQNAAFRETMEGKGLVEHIVLMINLIYFCNLFYF